MKASASNRKTATISIDIGKNTSTWLGWTSAGHRAASEAVTAHQRPGNRSRSGARNQRCLHLDHAIL